MLKVALRNLFRDRTRAAMMVKLALRNVFRHRARTAMTLAAIVFGVVGLILSGGFVRDIFVQLGEALIHSQTGHLQILRQGYYTAGSRQPEKFLIPNSAALRAKIGKMAEVDDVMARVNFAGLLNNGRTDWPVIGEGVEPDKEAKLGSHVRILKGRALGDRDRNGIVVGQGVAQALKIAPGDRVTLLVNAAEGALNSLDLVVIGVFQSFSRDFDARAIRIPLALAQELLRSKDVNGLVVSLKRTEDTEGIAARIGGELAGQPLEVRTWIELNNFYAKTVHLYERQFGILRLIILAMVLLSVANSVNMSMFERQGEFGTMMALGNPGRHVFRLILVESVLLGAIGSLIGVLVGVILAVAISAVGITMPPPPNADLGYTAHIRIAAGDVAVALAVGFLATTLAAILPAMRVSRTPVVDALRANV